MTLTDEHKQIIDILYSSYLSKGFLLEEETLEIMSSFDFSLKDTDRLIGLLLSKGVIFSKGVIQNDDDSSDYGFIDYDIIFNKVIKIDKNLKKIITYIKNIKPPQRHEFNNLYLQAKDGNTFAKNRIIEMYMRQAVRQALFFSKKYSYPLDECIQNAFIGLISGFEKYNINSSQKFSIYIIWRIRQNLYREILLGNYLINYPYHVKEDLFKVFHIYKNKSESYKHIYRKSIINKTKKYLSCSKEKAQFIFSIFQRNKNIDNLILSDNCVIESKIFSNITNSFLYDYLKVLLSIFPKKEHFIIKKHYGIDINEPLTLDAIGNLLNITRERVRQIENKALRRLRHPKRSKKLMKFFDHEVIEPSDTNLPKNEKFIDR